MLFFLINHSVVSFLVIITIFVIITTFIFVIFEGNKKYKNIKWLCRTSESESASIFSGY